VRLLCSAQQRNSAAGQRDRAASQVRQQDLVQRANAGVHKLGIRRVFAQLLQNHLHRPHAACKLRSSWRDGDQVAEDREGGAAQRCPLVSRGRVGSSLASALRVAQRRHDDRHNARFIRGRGGLGRQQYAVGQRKHGRRGHLRQQLLQRRASVAAYDGARGARTLRHVRQARGAAAEKRAAEPGHVSRCVGRAMVRQRCAHGFQRAAVHGRLHHRRRGCAEAVTHRERQHFLPRLRAEPQQLAHRSAPVSCDGHRRAVRLHAARDARKVAALRGAADGGTSR
jgi:hypothetical protein